MNIIDIINCSYSYANYYVNIPFILTINSILYFSLAKTKCAYIMLIAEFLGHFNDLYQN